MKRSAWRVALRPGIPVLVIAAGAGLRLARLPAAMIVWEAGLVVTGVPIMWRTLRRILSRQFTADIVAALAVLGAILIRQPVAGLVVVVMLVGGEALERFAEGRASAALRALQEAAPRVAHRITGDTVNDVPAGDVTPGDELLIRPGELIPCDGLVTGGDSAVDTAPITGEPLPLRAQRGVALLSGYVNGDGALVLRANARASESQYARIIELVRSAQASKSPLQRIADRYAVWFTPLTLALCALAYAISGDQIRVLSVLVIATPCPLILAAPIAIIGGINRAARQQIIVRTGAALEQLAHVTVAVFDKTGTLTIGRPEVSRVVALPEIGEPELLRLAASVEQRSSHLLARTLVQAAQQRGIEVPGALQVEEAAGRGVAGAVHGRQVMVGARSFLLEKSPRARPGLEALERQSRGLRAYVSVDGQTLGVVEYADRLRPGIAEFLLELRSLGVRREVILSGDHVDNAREVGDALGIAEARGDLLPQDKVDAVRGLVQRGEQVLMVGDGTNDAPALASASVGVALGGHGGGVTTEAADVVITTDELGRVTVAMRIAKRTMRIARQSIWVGLGLSAAGMLVATLGYIPPLIGAVLQEAIDVAVILNALRTSR